MEDKSFSTRKRLTYYIVADQANTHEELAQTAIKAAKTFQLNQSAHEVTVTLDPSATLEGCGYSLAIIDFAPDNGGYSGNDGWTWKTRVAKQRYSAKTMRIAEAWWANRDRFQKNGMTDEPAIIRYLSETLGYPEKEITLPWPDRTEYAPLNTNPKEIKIDLGKYRNTQGKRP